MKSSQITLAAVLPCVVLTLTACVNCVLAAPGRAAPPTRDPHSPGFVTATELPDGAVPPADANGNFIVGPTHPPAPEVAAHPLQGTVFEFTMGSADSKSFPGIAREAQTFGTPDASDPARLIVTTSHPAPYTRKVAVYVPKGYVTGTDAPFIVGADGPDKLLFAALDKLIAERKVPAQVAISIGNGSGDAQGSERGLEYDTLSGLYAEFVETEVLPLVEKKCSVTLSKDPDGRATMGTSSGGSCALSMAWYHPELYHRVLAYSGTFVNQQWPPNPATPHGAWGYHEHLIPESPAKPIRIWLEVGAVSDDDFFARAKAELATNIEAPLHLTSLFVNLKALTTVINVTSGLAYVPLVKAPVYSATKAFLHSFTLSLRHSLAGRGIEVIALIPPALNTDLGGKGLHDFAPPVSDFIKSVFVQLKEQKKDITFGFSEAMANAGPEELRKAFERMNPADRI